jgi:uncharacterized repeat protein (TIGR01451 family)
MRVTHSILSSRRSYVFATALIGLFLILIWIVPNSSRAALQQRGTTAAKARHLDFVPGEVLVRFRPQSEAAVASSKSGMSSAFAIADANLQVPMRIERLSLASDMVPGLRLARVAPAETMRAIEALRKRADVLYAEPNYIRRKSSTPNDPRYAELWGLNNTGQSSTSGGNPGTPGNDVRAQQAWNTTTGSRSVVVGIVDTGVDINHEDLRDNIWTNPGEVAGNGVDDDGNGLVDDIHGWDFAHNDASVFDYAEPSYPPSENYAGDFDDHGTHVAGTIGATGNNGIGVVGVNWQVSLMSLKFLTGPEGAGNSADLLKAFAYAKTMRDLWTSSGGVKGANLRVLNNSYGGDSFSQSELEAIQALGDSGILFVVAAGNEGLSNDMFLTYPSSYLASNLISVAASNGGGLRASFSNSGASVHVTAPGEHILSTTPRNTYNFSSGTSMSTPHVSGSAALMCAAFPNITLAKLRSLLLYSGFVANWQGQYNYSIATGRSVDVNAAIQGVTSSDVTPPGPINNINLNFPSWPNYHPNFATTGDDGTAGMVSVYEIRFSDTDLVDPAKFALATPLTGPIPVTGSFQNTDFRLPWRHPSGFIGIRAVDEVGNAGPITSIPISVDTGVADPYAVTTSGSGQLSTGGTPLGLVADDEYKQVSLPLGFRFYDGDWSFVTVSTNGALYFGFPPEEDFQSAPRLLNGYRMIAGLWDDLRTDRRPGDDVYVVKPDDNRIIFRWQAVTFDTPVAPGVTRGEQPVNFEIELQVNGTIVIRYGDGNQKVIPVVGLGGGWPEPYPVSSHISVDALKDLTNASSVTFTHRNPPPPPTARLALTMTNGPSPVSTGQQETYNIHVYNDGPLSAPNAVVTDVLPAGVNFVSCTTTLGTCAGPTPGANGTINVNLGTLNSNASLDITLVTQVGLPPGSSFSNTASVASTRFDSNLTDNSATAVTQVIQVPAFGSVSAITSAYNINFALKQDGSVWGWGKNDYGAMGNGSLYGVHTNPVPVNNLSSITAVSTGGTHSLALKSDGTVWSWGLNSLGETGGDGPSYTDARVVNGLSNVTAVSAGSNHSMALKSDGTVWIWGGNDRGQLGLGTLDSDRHPTPVIVPGLTGVNSISAGTGFSVVVRNDGTVWTWGENLNGQLGVAGASTKSPAQVGGVSGVKAVSVSYNHVLALKTDGTVVGWGMNAFGQTGSTNFVNVNPAPAVVSGLSGVSAVAAGYGFSLALKTDGTVWGWGLNAIGQLGNGATGSNPQTAPTLVSAVSNATAIAAGNSHGVALLTNGTLRTWGENTNAQLGDGTTFNRLTPVEVTGILIVSQPLIFPGNYVAYPPITVTVTSQTTGSVIHYTTNGLEPTENDAVIDSGGQIVVTQDLTLKARAFKTGWVPSAISTATYTVLIRQEVQLTLESYSVNESSGSAAITVNRTGGASGISTVQYATSDAAGLSDCNVANGIASARCDYATSIGTLTFAPGETSKTIFIPLVNDGYAEGNESLTVTLSNPWGINLGPKTSATISIQDNDSVNTTNPIDDVDFFIRQQYIDFLGREPDPAGLAGWRNVLNNCGTTVQPPCDRLEVSAGFFRSEEFQARGYFVYRFYSALGKIPLSNEFFPDFAKVSGFLSADQLEANKVAYVNEVMARAEFQTKYGATFNNATAYVDALLQTVGLPNHPSRTGWIALLNGNNSIENRGIVLRQLVESSEVYNKYYNEAFVIMQYFGYLRRTADVSYTNWIQTMNQSNGDYRTMINGFMNSAEYRKRFGN